MAAEGGDGLPHGPLYDFRALGFQPGEVVVVTGAASGIGRATALAAAKSGLAVGVWDRDGLGARDAAAAIVKSGGRAVAVTVDVGDDAGVAAAWEATAPLGACAYLVNNAGPANASPQTFDENLGLALGSVHRVTESWLARHGAAAASVVSVSSVIGNQLGGGGSAFYPAAKAGIAGYTRYLAAKHAGRPRANAVAPGLTITPRTQPIMDQPAIRARVARIPLGRAGLPEESASAVLFLLSPAAAYVNGAVLPVDGGWTTA